MGIDSSKDIFDKLKKKYPQKFVTEDNLFSDLHRGDRIFIG